MNRILLLFLFVCSFNLAYSQFFTEDFDDNTGTATFTFTNGPCNDGNEDYFGIVCLNGGGCGNEIATAVTYTGGDGGSFLGAQDTNGDPDTGCSSSSSVSLLIDDIDINGQSDIHICFEIAEDDDGSNQDWDTDSSVGIQFDVDNTGTFTNIIAIESVNTMLNQEPALDTDCDGIGNGPVLTNIFTTYCFSISGTGALMDLNIAIENLNDGDEDIAIDNIQLFSGAGSLPAAVTSGCEAPPTTSVEFATTSAIVNETDGTYDLLISITNPDAGVATTGDVIINAGDGTDIDGFTTASFSFAAGSAADETIVITITDDMEMESLEDIVFEITNVAGGNSAVVGTNNLFTLSIQDDDTPPSPLVISEIMYNTPTSQGTDDEWIEICNTSSSPIDIINYDILVVGGTSTPTFTFTAALDVPAEGCITVSLGNGGGVAYNDDCVFIPDVDLSDGGDNNLTNSNRTIILQDGFDGLVDEVAYSTSDGANGNGKSLILTDLSLDNSDTGNGNWEESINDGGSPGEAGNGGCTNVTTSVQFTTTSASSSENTPENTIDLTISILNPDATNATTGDVIINTGDAADVDSYTTQSFTFAAGDATDQTITITITDDMEMESIEDIIFEITNVAGGNAAIVGIENLFTLTINDNDTPVAEIAITEWINNVAGNESTEEWFEIYNYGATTVDLMGYSISDLQGTFDITTSTPIEAGAYLVFAQDKVAFEANWLGGTPSPKVIEYSGISSLANGGDALTLTDGTDQTVWSVSWGDGETAGVSVEIRPDFDFGNLPVTHPVYTHDTYPGSDSYINTSSATMSVAGDIGTPCAGSAPLSVNLTTFHGQLINGQVQLKWTTASEINNAYFSIQRSTNNKDFEEIGKQTGQGTSQSEKTYSFVDNNPSTGLNYYRLEQVDFNGNTTFSETITMEIKDKDGVVIYPTIANQILTIEFGQPIEEKQTINIFDVNGQLVQTERLENGLLKTNIQVSNLASGVYFLKIESNTIARFVKE